MDDQELIKQIEAASVYEFIRNHQIKNETGEILDFDKYRFMRAVYWDDSPLICCMKCAQIGFTTYEIIKSAHECKNEGYDIIYVLPTGDDVKKFSGGKTNKILAQNPVMLAWTKDKDSIEQKQFGSNTIYYQGSWTERAALMITAKKLIVDEYDRCKQQIVEQYDSRLQSVADPKKAFFSNPSIPDYGIDKLYKLSDQKKWHITHSCGRTYVMDEKCINYEEETYTCPYCAGLILDEERRMGEWRPTSQGEWSGYWIPLWIAPWMPAKKIAEAKRLKSPEYFANFVAGTPYIGGGNKVSAEILERNLFKHINRQDGTIIIGVDTGIPIHYVIGNKEGIFFYGTCKDYATLEALLKRWPRSVIVSDQGGDLIGIRELQERYRGRVFLCTYRKVNDKQMLWKWGEGEEYGKVTADRNRTIQLVVDEFTDKRLPLNYQDSPSEYQQYITHWLNIYRRKEYENENEPEYGWRYVWERTGPDHFAHATVYWRIGMDKFSESMAEIIGGDDGFMSNLQTGRIFKQE